MHTYSDFQAWSEAVFKREGAMTKAQFIDYAYEYLFGEGTQCLFDRIAEARSEIAMFGDAGPGALYRLRELVQEYNIVATRYEQFTGQKVQRICLPSPR